jgi:dihydroxyacetone kinase-like predicted kinase
VRDATAGGVAVHRGDVMGLYEGRVVAASGDPADVLHAVVARLLEGGGELLTVLRGAPAAELPGAVLESVMADVGADHPELEIELHDGGQPLYPVLLAIE